jgi:glycosyltransferase involved in cell wall biosynthesis
MRVLLVSSKYPPEYAGSGLRAHQTYKRLQNKYGLQFDVLCSSVTSNSNTVYEHEGVKVTRIARKILPQRSSAKLEGSTRSLRDKLALRLNYFTETSATENFLRQYLDQYDLVHVFGNVAVTAAVIDHCNRIKKPLIVEFCNELDTPYPYKPLLAKMFNPIQFHPQTQFICISKRLESMCRRNGITQSIWTRPNPVDVQRFHLERHRKSEHRRKNTIFNDQDIVLLNISNFIPRKNQILIIEALRLLPERFKLVLGGPIVEAGPHQTRDAQFLEFIKAKIEEYGLPQRVQLTPRFISNIEEYMKMADVYVFPTKAEGLGTPMLESICCGTPVVATRIEGITDQWIKDGVNGYLSELDAADLAQRIQQAVKIPLSQLDRAAQALQSVVDTNAIDAVYYRLLDSLAQGKIIENKDISYGVSVC